MATARLRHERDLPGASATSLVHSAYLRLVGGKGGTPESPRWQNRAHFFGAASLAMRRILVDRARRRAVHRSAMSELTPAPEDDLAADLLGLGVDMLALDEAMEALERLDAAVYRTVMLRYFAGLSVEDAAEISGVSASTVKRQWAFARLWLLDRIGHAGNDEAGGTGGGGRGS